MLASRELRREPRKSSNAPASLQKSPTIAFDPPDMIEYVHHAQRTVNLKPRTYWCEFPFYTIFVRETKFPSAIALKTWPLLRPLSRKAWKKHQAHLSRLERFPLEKAEYFQRLKGARYKERQGPCRGHGEDWSYIARVLKTLVLAEPIKDYLRTHKYDPTVVKFFHLRVLLDIVRQDEERLQLGRFRSLWRSLKKEIC